MQVKIVEAGAVEPLVGLLGQSWEGAKDCAIGALMYLAMNNENIVHYAGTHPVHSLDHYVPILLVLQCMAP